MNRKKTYSFFRCSSFAGITFELVSYAFMLLCGYLLSSLLENVMAGQWQQMYDAGILAVLALVVTILPKYALSVWRSKVKLADTQRFREYLYQCVLDRTIHVNNGGEMTVRMNSDVKTIAKYFQETCPKAISGTTILLCSTVLICIIDWRIGLIFFALNLTQLIPIVVYEKWSRQIYNQTHSDEETYCNWMLEGYNGIRTIKAYCVEHWYMKKYYDLNGAIVSSGKRAEQVGTIENIIFQAIDSLLNYGSYVIIGLFVLMGGFGIGEAPLLVILGGYLFSAISSIFDLRLQQFDYQEAYKRMGFKDIPPTKQDADCVLRVVGVTKSFDDRLVLNGVSCVVCSGDRVLLRGDNGSGKSTLLRIITGLEEADSGFVTYGVRKNDIAISLQEEPELNISGKELVHAMEEAGCIDMDMLKQHFKGFCIEMLLSKQLSEMSPGERKKFYLSVALAHHGKLLILDEPTNHIDQHSFQYLREQLRVFAGTLIVCTHAADLDLGWNKTILMEGGQCYES